MAQQRPDQILQRLPIAVGILLGVALLVNRGATPELFTSQARSDVLGVIACAVLILTGLLWMRIQPRLPDSVELVGEEGFELDPTLPESVRLELAWASHLLLTNTATRSLVVFLKDPESSVTAPTGKTVLRRGILGPKDLQKPGQIVRRALKKEKSVYLVGLATYPGKIEFDYLPENTQGVIVQPMGDRGVLILGANAPRSYTNQDERWVAGIADKLANSFDNASNTSANDALTMDTAQGS
ncbi:MAG: cofactor assembly of complex C subunit B [Cyanobacteria bacterium P01_C01_bin.89]